jgi:hypothetical protein
MLSQRSLSFAWVAVAVTIAAAPLNAQQVPWSPLQRSSDNIEVLGHLPLGAALSVADMDLEQEMSRLCLADGLWLRRT